MTLRRTTNAKDKGRWAHIDMDRLANALDSAIRKATPASTAPQPRFPSPPPTTTPRGDPRLAQGPSAPMIAGSGLWAPLGTTRGREFGTIAMTGFEGREFELIDDGRPVLNLDDGAYYLAYPEREPWRVGEDESGNDRTEFVDKFRRVQPWPLGTFEKLTKPRGAGTLKDAMPIDALTGHPFLGKRPATRQSILALLAREGISVARGMTGELLVSSPGGRWPKGWVVDVLGKPGMADYLTTELVCAWPHDGEAPLAQTLGITGEGICSSAAHRVKPATGIVGKLKAAIA